MNATEDSVLDAAQAWFRAWCELSGELHHESLNSGATTTDMLCVRAHRKLAEQSLAFAEHILACACSKFASERAP